MKLTYTRNNMTFEAEFETVQEKNLAMKLIKYAINDVESMEYDLAHPEEYKERVEQAKTAQESNESTVDNKISMLPPEPATDGQKRYMDKIGVKYTKKTTKAEAIDLINDWKRANGIKVDEELSAKSKQRRTTK